MDFNKLVDTDRATEGLHGNTRYPAKRKTPVNYTARKTSGRARVIEGYEGETGPWVVVADVVTGKRLALRPSQVGA